MKFGLIGHPIEHSMSPTLFRAGYDGRYPYELIETPDLEDAYARFIQEYDGINVTAPFKEGALRKADIISEECRLTGATNLLVKTPEGIKAYNSDYRGVQKWLEERSADFEGEVKVLIVGYGGAGKAAAAAARSLGMDVCIMNRTITEDSILPLDEFRRGFREADIIIYNIPGPIPQMDELGVDDFRGGTDPSRKIILEANYREPSFTVGLKGKMAQANPLAEYVSGRTWLLYQAVTGYEIFTGERPDLAKMAEVI